MSRRLTVFLALVLVFAGFAPAAEQLVDLAYTTVAAGGYTGGSGLLNVASTSTGSGALPFPATGVFSVSISDPTTRIVKTLLEVTAINSGTQFATASIAGLDVNAVVGDLVEAVQDKRSLTAFVQGPAWVGLSYANSWTDFGGGYQTGQYSKDGTGRVWLRGLIKAGTLTFGTTLFTLPAGFRPALLQSVIGFIISSGGVITPQQIDITAAGVAILQTSGSPTAGGALWLNSICFSVN